MVFRLPATVAKTIVGLVGKDLEVVVILIVEIVVVLKLSVEVLSLLFGPRLFGKNHERKQMMYWPGFVSAAPLKDPRRS